MKAARTRARNAKHAGTRKHAATSKHRPTATKSAAAAHRAKVHVKHLSPKQAKARALSLGSVSCCSAAALGRSLRLAGWPVGADDVLALHWAASGGVDAGVSIWGVLAAAERSGLAGIRPVGFDPYPWDPAGCTEDDVFGVDDRDVAALAVKAEALPPVQGEAVLHSPVREAVNATRAGHLASIILGLDMPEGPHAVTLDPTGAVWSWGGLHDLWPDVVVEEAWRVVWPSWL